MQYIFFVCKLLLVLANMHVLLLSLLLSVQTVLSVIKCLVWSLITFGQQKYRSENRKEKITQRNTVKITSSPTIKFISALLSLLDNVVYCVVFAAEVFLQCFNVSFSTQQNQTAEASGSKEELIWSWNPEWMQISPHTQYLSFITIDGLAQD